LEVHRTVNDEAKRAQLAAIVAAGGPGIVYVATTRERQETQRAFMAGETPIVVATEAKVVVAQLVGAGILARGRRLRLVRDFADADELDAFLGAYEAWHADDHRRLESMMRYAESTTCRVQTLRRWFGEPEPPPCGRCDSCRNPTAGIVTAAPGAAAT
jgi:superfamily II DNA helicase RecQ